MRMLRSVLASLLVGAMMLAPITAYASNETEYTEIEEAVESNSGIDTQLNELYHEIGDNLGINYMYVKIMHLIAGGKVVYADSMPNIRVDETVDSLPGPFEIAGVDQSYNQTADWVYCPDDTVIRPSKYYLPDAAYNVMLAMIPIMNNRYFADRGIMQSYFDALNTEVKTTIIFCEAVLEYTGSSDAAINSFYSCYESILYNKDKDENIIEQDSNGNYNIKSKFKNILIANGISKDEEINYLCTILRFDGNLAGSASSVELSSYGVIPYTLNYQSRENLIRCAISVIGKVRYVWGGGHGGTGGFEGINPNWQLFYNTYSQNEEDENFDKCIRPNISWCPIHGSVVGNPNGCLFESKSIQNLDDFLNERAELYNTEALRTDEYAAFIDKLVEQYETVQSHRLDGLDCSGYTSWVYNQVTDEPFIFDSGAYRFSSQYGVDTVSIGSRLYAGDCYSWSSHIFMILGRLNDKNNVYIMSESSPTQLKFGVAYYEGATEEDIEKAVIIAKNANKIFGNIGDAEWVNQINMTTKVYAPVTNDGTFGKAGFHVICRLNKSFIDSDTVIPGYDKTINDMDIVEVLQYMIDTMPYQYLSGLDTYDGSIFDITQANINKQAVSNMDVQDIVNNDTKLIDELQIKEG